MPIREQTIADVLSGEGQEGYLWSLLQESGILDQWLSQDLPPSEENWAGHEKYDPDDYLDPEGFGLKMNINPEYGWSEGGDDPGRWDPFHKAGTAKQYHDRWEAGTHRAEFGFDQKDIDIDYDTLSDFLTGDEFYDMSEDEIRKFIEEGLIGPAVEEGQSKALFEGQWSLGDWTYSAFGEKMGSDLHGEFYEDFGKFTDEKLRDIKNWSEDDWDKYGEMLRQSYVESGEGVNPKIDQPGADPYGGHWGAEETPSNVLYDEEGNITMESFKDLMLSKGEYSSEFDALRAYSGYTTNTEDIDAMTRAFMAIQGGADAIPTAEGWGLGTKLSTVESGGKRKASKLLESYVPKETLSRYKALQTGTEVTTGEAEEQEYLSSIFGEQREQERDILSIYDEFMSDRNRGAMRWLGGLSDD